MGTQSAKVNVQTGEILSLGYPNPAERASEGYAEVLFDNIGNHDPDVGFLLLSTERYYSPDDIIWMISEAGHNNTLGFSQIFAG